MTEREVWITGIGALTSLGLSIDDTWAQLQAGQTGTALFEDDAAKAVNCNAGASLEGFKARKFVKNRKSLKLMTRPVRLGVSAASQAFAMAGLEEGSYDPEKLGIFVGAGQAFADQREIQSALEMARDGDALDMVQFGAKGLDMIHPLWLLRGLSNNVLGFVSLDFNAQGINNNFANSGVSGAQAIIAAADAIREGRIEMSFAGSYDTALASECMVGYGRLGMMAKQSLPPESAHRPFDRSRTGFVPGEGACFLMLESAESAAKRGATPLARVEGGSVTMDGFAVADPDPAGTGLRQAIENGLRRAGIGMESIGAVFAHGASSVRYDAIEAAVYRDLLGDRAGQVPITTDKAGVGHTLAASSSISAAVAAYSLRDQRLAPISTLQDLDPACEGLHYVTGQALDHSFSHALVCSAGAGGQASALILSAIT